MKKFLLGLLLCFVFLPNVSSAIPITDGFIHAYGAGFAGPRIFSFGGADYNVSGKFVHGIATGGDSWIDTPNYSIDANVVGLDLGYGYYTSSTERLAVNWGYINASGPSVFRITGPSIPLGSEAGVYTGSFSFTGSLCGTTYPGSIHTLKPCDVWLPALEGVGIVRAVLYKQKFKPENAPVFSVQEVTYTFTNPIPEPSTMILLCTGIAGLAGWGRRKFKKNQ